MSASMENVEDSIRRIVIEIRLLESAAEQIQARMNLINAALTELNMASMSLEGIKKKDSDQIFVHIGGGSYIKARLEETDKVVYGIGAGISIEKTIEEAKNGIANRIAELSRAKMALEQQLNQVIAKIREEQSRLQELASMFRRQSEGGNV